MKVLMVCLGNICRSPLAEGILKQKIYERELDWQVDSAGTGAYHIGESPDPRSIAIARTHGIDISGQRARQIQLADFQGFDLILAMDAANFQHIQRLAQSDAQRDKIHLIMNFDQPGRNESVPDPYWDDDGFAKVYQMLDRATDRLIADYAVEC